MNLNMAVNVNKPPVHKLQQGLKPLLKYPGGKSSELKYILPLVPKTVDRYFEPFLGGGAAYFAINHANSYYVNDISEELIAVYNAVKAQDSEFFSTLSLLNEDWKLISGVENISFDLDIENLKFVPELNIIKLFSLEPFFAEYISKMARRRQSYLEKQRAKGVTISEQDKRAVLETIIKSSYYASVRKIYNENRKLRKIEGNAPFYFFIREFCYSSMFRFSKSGNFNVPYGGKSYNNKHLTEKLNYLKSNQLRSHLQNTNLFDTDFQSFVDQFTLTSDDFVFLDPPYDTEFSTYDGNEFHQEDQKRLSDFLINTQAKWLLVIKDTDFIRSLYPSSNSKLFYQEFDKSYSVSFMNRNVKTANHLMIANYEIKL